MVVVSVHSSEESSGHGDGGGAGVTSGVGIPAAGEQVASGYAGNAASPSLVSSTFLEANPSEDTSMPPSPEGDKLINGYAIFLLKGVYASIGRWPSRPKGGHAFAVIVGLLRK